MPYYGSPSDPSPCWPIKQTVQIMHCKSLTAADSLEEYLFADDEEAELDKLTASQVDLQLS